MTTSARRSARFFWPLLASALLCAGIAYADCHSSRPQETDFHGRYVNEGFGINDGGHRGHNHNGLDLRTRDNPTVRPYFGGTADTFNSDSYGRTVTVTNGNIRALYAHAGRLSVRDGQQVTRDTVLGDWSTTSGDSTGPHIHLEYQVRQSNGEWVKVDPIETQRLIDQGMNPQDPGFAQAAITATTTRCNMSADQLGRGGTGRGGQYQQVCDPEIHSRVSAQVRAALTRKNEFETANATPPPSNQQIANRPCMSKELKRISDQFAYAPTKWAQQFEGNVMSAAGPASNIMQKMFKSEFESINKAAASVQGMLDFQSMASEVMGDLLESIGLGDAFSSEVCGLMADMLFKYIQCENPIKIPDLPNFTGSLNDLIPNNCAGNALRSTIYEAGNMESLKNLNQSIPVQAGGTFSHEAGHQPGVTAGRRQLPGAF